MTRSSSVLCLLAASFCLTGAVSTNAETAPPESTDPMGFDGFIQEGLRSGLLRAPGESDIDSEPLSEPHGQSEPDTSETETLAEAPEANAVESAQASEFACPNASTLDFNPYADFEGYEDLARVGLGGGAVEDHHAALERVRAYISLGLFSEALRNLRDMDGPDPEALEQVAALLDGRKGPDIRFFDALSQCNTQGEFWNSLSSTIAGEPDPDGLARHFRQYRGLPIEVRSEIAFRAVPMLAKIGERILAEKFLVEFPDEVFAANSKLQYAKAVLGLYSGDPEADAFLRGIIQNPRFRDQALALLIRRDRAVEEGLRDIYVDDVQRRLTDDPDGESHKEDVDIALNALSVSADYEELAGLVDVPYLQDEIRQSDLRGRFAARASADLESDEELRRLAALDAITDYPQMLGDPDDKERLARKAFAASVDFGLVSTADLFWDMSDAHVDKDEIREWAQLAFDTQAFETVYMLTEKYPDVSELSLLGARSAIVENEPEVANKYLQEVDRTPEVLLTLLEEDALSGHWILSDDMYAAALALPDEALKQRAQRIEALRRMAHEGANTSHPVPLGSIAERLRYSAADVRDVNLGGDR